MARMLTVAVKPLTLDYLRWAAQLADERTAQQRELSPGLPDETWTAFRAGLHQGYTAAVHALILHGHTSYGEG